MTAKPDKRIDYLEVTYTKSRWKLLRKYREEAAKILSTLKKFHLHGKTHGSIARGDVNAKSDVDIFIPEPRASFLVETALERAGVQINTRLLVQATPTYTIKAHIEIDDRTSVSFPLVKMRKVEREFYRFGGEIDLAQINKGIRTPGVNKRLRLIEPTEKGHVETSVVGREESVARVLGISVETVFNRVNALSRRDEIGRTGVFLKKELESDETFELALKKLADENPVVRRRIRTML